MIIDEVQRHPDRLHAVKRVIDRQRQPCRFLLTGSADLLLMRRVSESLAGRASYLSLWPMTRDHLWLDLVTARPDGAEDWRSLAWRGGFPGPAVHQETGLLRRIWFDGYVQTYLDRDLQGLSAITALPDSRRLVRAACLQLGQFVYPTQLGRIVSLP